MPQQTIDLRSVAYASFFWKNQFGERVRCKPRKPTVHCKPIPADTICENGETPIQRASRLGILDRWTPVCLYQFRNSHSMMFTNQKAKDKFATYNKHIYG